VIATLPIIAETMISMHQADVLGLLAEPGGVSTRPWWKRIPFGHSHAAFFVSNPYENEWRVILPGFGPDKDGCRAVCVSHNR